MIVGIPSGVDVVRPMTRRCPGRTIHYPHLNHHGKWTLDPASILDYVVVIGGRKDTVMTTRDQAGRTNEGLDADVSELTDSVIEAIRPVIEQRIRECLGAMAGRQVRAMLMPLLEEAMNVHTSPASPAKEGRFSGTSTAGVVEYMRTRAGEEGARGADILDFLQDHKGVGNRETARKAISRVREMGLIRKDERSRWQATDKLKELPA